MCPHESHYPRAQPRSHTTPHLRLCPEKDSKVAFLKTVFLDFLFDRFLSASAFSRSTKLSALCWASSSAFSHLVSTKGSTPLESFTETFFSHRLRISSLERVCPKDDLPSRQSTGFFSKTPTILDVRPGRFQTEPKLKGL